ncbi:hypothetical protein QJQ45_024798, partial [Haematococcus lacustris]
MMFRTCAAILSLIVLTSADPWPHTFNTTARQLHCDRERSREARDIITKAGFARLVADLHTSTLVEPYPSVQYVFPQLGNKVKQLPAGCPLLPSVDVDVLLAHEQHKARKNAKHMKCQYCGKMFKSELFIDRHMQRKHVDQVPEATLQTAHICLADLCDVLHCDWFAAQRRKAGRRTPNRSVSSAQGDQGGGSAAQHCLPHAVTLTRSRCQELAHKWAASCNQQLRDSALRSVLTPPSHPILTVILLLLILLVLAACTRCLCTRGAPGPSHSRGQQGSSRGAAGGRPAGRHSAAQADADPAAKLHRHPHARPSLAQPVRVGHPGARSVMMPGAGPGAGTVGRPGGGSSSRSGVQSGRAASQPVYLHAAGRRGGGGGPAASGIGGPGALPGSLFGVPPPLSLAVSTSSSAVAATPVMAAVSPVSHCWAASTQEHVPYSQQQQHPAAVVSHPHPPQPAQPSQPPWPQQHQQHHWSASQLAHRHQGVSSQLPVRPQDPAQQGRQQPQQPGQLGSFPATSHPVAP